MKQDLQTQVLQAKLQKRLDEKLLIEARIRRLRQKAVSLENKIDRITIKLNEPIPNEV